jgi:hypothetical protein
LALICFAFSVGHTGTANAQGIPVYAQYVIDYNLLPLWMQGGQIDTKKYSDPIIAAKAIASAEFQQYFEGQECRMSEPGISWLGQGWWAANGPAVIWNVYCPKFGTEILGGAVGANLIAVCENGAGATYAEGGWLCGAGLQITLTGPIETRPAGTGGISTVTITAKVTSGGLPKAGISVGLGVEVATGSGGHDSGHVGARPKGKLSAIQGTTDANGEVKVVFQPSQIAGVHIVAATCIGCQTAAAHEITVKVPDLVDVFAMPFRDAQWSYPGIGDTPQHPDNHYLTIAATFRLLEIASKFRKIWPNAPKLTLNDMSLKHGGKFDIKGGWESNPKAHNEHRLGDNADIRANNAFGAVPPLIRESSYRWFRTKSTPEDQISDDLLIESVNPLWENPDTDNEHFHLRLGN